MEGNSQNQEHDPLFPAERMIFLLGNQDHFHAGNHHAFRRDRGYNYLESYLGQDGEEILNVTENDGIRGQPVEGHCHGSVLLRHHVSLFIQTIRSFSLTVTYCYFPDWSHMKHPSPQQFPAHVKWHQPG